MIGDTLLWFLLLPVIGGIAIWWLTGHKRDGLIPAATYVVISGLCIAAAFYLARSSATDDIEIWSGQVTGKERVHDTYRRSYDCNCRSVETCTGSGKTRSCSSRQVCDTCYEDRYTVTWRCGTTVGPYTIKHLDETTRRVYSTPDPARWVAIKAGDPVAKAVPYTNYVQAVPESLFTPAAAGLKQRFASLVPPYPDQVYDFYRLDRFLAPGHTVADAAEWQQGLAELLKERGPRRQVNAIVVVAKTADRDYTHALRDAWQGANKNDVVLVIGSSEWPKVDFVEVISWTKNELFKVQLRDEVQAMGTIERQKVLDALGRHIDATFERRRMREFEYLQAEIDPPGWMLALLLVGMVGGAAGAVVYHRRRPQPCRFQPPRSRR